MYVGDCNFMLFANYFYPEWCWIVALHDVNKLLTLSMH